MRTQLPRPGRRSNLKNTSENSADRMQPLALGLQTPLLPRALRIHLLPNPSLPRCPGLHRRQRGATLVIGLLFLVLLTIMGLSAMNLSALEERMSGNTRERTLAFEAGEAALRDCELVLQGATTPVFQNALNSSGLYKPVVGQNWWDVITWTAANSRVYTGTISGVSSQPRCIIEELPYATGMAGNQSLRAGQQQEDSGMYRITARAVGINPNTVVMLQSMYKR